MTYTAVQRSKAAAWKAVSMAIPQGARGPAPYVGKDGDASGPAYDFCLPANHAACSLLPEVRDLALDVFAELGIPWHAGVSGGPSNHLLSSQVQCVNALAMMMVEPARITAAFAGVLDIAEVLPIEPGRYLTFEYIGPTDFFNESPGVARVRGARCTSVDAAIKYRASDGAIELALIEWKYTESYRVRDPEPAKDRTRAARYASHVTDPDGPVRADLLPFELLLDEPFYQLVRQQLLAHQLEKVGAEGAARVHVLHVLSPDNVAYQRSLARPEHRELGSTVSAVWQRLLRSHDRFLTVDPTAFLDPGVTSREYGLRYADDVVYDEAGLLSAFEIPDVGALTDIVDNEAFEGDVETSPEGVELIYEGVGTLLGYPFRAVELLELACELAEDQ